MKIGELLELTQTDALAKIAKERLTVGKEKARDGLQKAGCYSKNGIKGWFFDGNKSVLEQSIYDFVEIKQVNRQPRPKVNASVNKSTSESNNDSNKIATSELLAIEEIAATSEIKANKKLMNSELASNGEYDAIDMLLIQNDNESSKRVYRGFYWDKDVITFLDNVKHGNKSDLMNEIVRTVLKNKGLI
ncbi:TPA: hypothetical protein MMJ71_004782 [Salmonella enterica subsp. enterica serovar Typhimurium]|nr:hypothetical protein [Salmonella enterica subsp. enterica serovar Typhimurium]